MSEQEYAELTAHADDLERAALALLETSFKARYSHERTHAAGASTGYEAAAIWLRGFLRRHTEQSADAQPPDDASIKARWG